MNIKGIIKGTIISYIAAVFSILLGAVLIYHNIFKVQLVSVCLFIGISLGVFIGAYIAAKNAHSRIILNSLSVCLMFILLLVFVSIILNGRFAMHTRTTVLIISTVAAGTLGAIFGNRN